MSFPKTPLLSERDGFENTLEEEVWPSRSSPGYSHTRASFGTVMILKGKVVSQSLSQSLSQSRHSSVTVTGSDKHCDRDCDKINPLES